MPHYNYHCSQGLGIFFDNLYGHRVALRCVGFLHIYYHRANLIMGNWHNGGRIDPSSNGFSIKPGNQEIDQARGKQDLYGLVDLKGGGYLVQLMKAEDGVKGHQIFRDGSLELKIRESVKKFLYNDGDGEYISVRELVRMKRAERPGSPTPVKICDHHSQEDLLSKSTETLRMSPRLQGYPNFRFVCWNINQRGSVGETILHICLLMGSDIHRELAIHLIRCFPNLINDIYLSDKYYGELPLHLAIVNGDVEMVELLLERGSHFDQRARCSGSFFTSKDQENSRRDCEQQEHTTFSRFETNYNGICYYGEYPLSFAVSMNQPEIFKKLYEKGANPNWQDSNGNTTLHMAVIHDKMDMYKLAYSLGGDSTVKNYQGLNPLALCCLLGRKELFEYILDLESEVFWTYGNTVCASHPLENVDSIQTVDSNVGDATDTQCRVNPKSVISLVVGGTDDLTNKMLDGIVVDILNNKWKNFIRYQFGFRMAIFIIYYTFLSISFSLRPGRAKIANETASDPSDSCYLKWNTNEDMVRLIFEILTVIGAIYHIMITIREVLLYGWLIILRSVEDSKLKILFFGSCLLVLLTIILRLTCSTEAEEWILVTAIITASFHSFYYLRGFSLTGTFIVMIKRMITRDLLRFMIIYLVYIVGFAQGMLVLFNKSNDSVFSNFAESLMSMFIMSLGEFRIIYQTFDQLDSPLKSYIGKTLFVVYMILVTLMLVNTFIAMMSQTYQMVAESKKQALRQWAKVILDIELSTDPHSLIYMQKTYSLPLLVDKDDPTKVAAATSQRLLINTKKVVEGADFDNKKKLKIQNKEKKSKLLERTENGW